MKTRLSSLLAAACAAVAAVPAHANLLNNGSFEAMSAAASPFYIRSFASTPGWTQYADGVDLIHNSYTQGPPVLVDASDGVQFLDMNQAGAIGGLYQIVAVTPGQSYTLTLDVTAWATNSIPGTVGYRLVDPASNTTLVSGSFTETVANNTWNTVTLTAVAISSQLTVDIYGISANQAGIGVDNVVLTAVPEPGAWALMLAGGAAMLGLARRRGAAPQPR